MHLGTRRYGDLRQKERGKSGDENACDQKKQSVQTVIPLQALVQGYNAIVNGRFAFASLRLGSIAAVLILLGSSTACNRAAQNKDAVKSGVVEHLSKNSGLDLSSMDVEVTNVSFSGDQANATIAFRPKESPNQGMSMNYTLERQGAKWVVKGREGGSMAPGGAAGPSQGGSDLPPGHPPVGAPGAGSAPGGQLPPGHPPVGGSETTRPPAK